jgi:hypothetical protein
MEFRIGEAVPGQAKIVSVEDKPGPEGISIWVPLERWEEFREAVNSFNPVSDN